MTVVAGPGGRYTRDMRPPPLPVSMADRYHATWFDYVDARGRRFEACPVGAQAPCAAWDLPEAFAVVTAWNPDSTPRSRAENDAANVRLHDDLRARGASVRPIVGRSEDRTWEEHSFAVWGLTRDEVSQVAVTYGQHAIFVVTRGRRTLGDGNRRADDVRGVWLHVTKVA